MLCSFFKRYNSRKGRECSSDLYPAEDKSSGISNSSSEIPPMISWLTKLCNRKDPSHQIFEQGPVGYKHFGHGRCSGKNRSFVSMRVKKYKKIPRFTMNSSIFVDGDDLDDEKYF